nr:acyl-CoA dehydrogenase [Streptomyces sp. RLB1-33]QIY73922.1 acyl-CoA dehydrogenase [Streptomyces sp. RLB1-33]
MTGIRTRMDTLEERLGDPWDPANPVGFDAVVAADEREETPAAGAALLDEYGILAEFVPDWLGGRFERVDHLVELMRSVYRRDPSLGLGHCSSSLIGSVNVWTAGSPTQRRAAAELLLAGGKISCAFHELAHGNDVGSVEFAARRAEGGLVLKGRKETISNLDRADAVVFLARTDPGGGPRSCSQLFVPVTELDPGRVRFLPRFRSVGMRGVRLGGITVDDCPVGTDALLGAPGTGLETTARAFQLTRVALPAMSTAMLDTALRVTLHHVRRRRLYGRAVADIPMVRTTLANAFTDLLLCEALAQVAARSLHLLPESGSLYAPAVKYLLAGVLLDTLEQLSLVMGAEFYRRDGEHAVFQKTARDIRPIGFGHIARAACLSAMLPQLPVLARRAWRNAAPAPAALFTPDAELPPLDLAGLRLMTGGRDSVAPRSPPLSTTTCRSRYARWSRATHAVWRRSPTRARASARRICRSPPPSRCATWHPDTPPPWPPPRASVWPGMPRRAASSPGPSGWWPRSPGSGAWAPDGPTTCPPRRRARSWRSCWTARTAR